MNIFNFLSLFKTTLEGNNTIKKSNLNYKRGFFRIWVLISCTYVLFVVPISLVNKPNIYTPLIWVAPPLILLVLGIITGIILKFLAFIINWIINGFKESKPNKKEQKNYVSWIDTFKNSREYLTEQFKNLCSVSLLFYIGKYSLNEKGLNLSIYWLVSFIFLGTVTVIEEIFCIRKKLKQNNEEYDSLGKSKTSYNIYSELNYRRKDIIQFIFAITFIYFILHIVKYFYPNIDFTWFVYMLTFLFIVNFIKGYIQTKKDLEESKDDEIRTTSMILAIKNSDVETVKKLIKENVYINSRIDDSEDTLLTLAVRRGNLDIIKLIIKAGADINGHFGDGWTPLHTALINHLESDIEIVKLLIKSGANVNFKTIFGYTPLKVTLDNFLNKNPNNEIIKILIAAGADINEKDIEGKTAYDYASNNEGLKNNIEILNMLKPQTKD